MSARARFLRCLAGLSVVFGGSAWSILGQAPIAQPLKSSLSRASFTEPQAERGRQAYEKACTYCHRADLSGNEDGAPTLRGNGFLERWSDRTLAELSFVIKETMPQDDPGTLTDTECTDIVAFILKRNGAPAGQIELASERASPPRQAR